MPELLLFPDTEALTQGVLGRLRALGAGREVLRLAVTGGSMGEALADALRSSWAEEAPELGLWFSDERFVPADSPDRLDRHFLPLAGRANVAVHSAPADEGQGLEAAVAAFQSGLPEAFDVVFLGLGPDGHVASLFPGRPELDDPSLGILSVAGSPKPPPERLSFSLPLINSAAEVWVLAGGASKADAMRELWDGTAWRGTGELPASRVSGTRDTLWFADLAAVGREA